MKYIWILLLIGCTQANITPTLTEGNYTGEYYVPILGGTSHDAVATIQGLYLTIEGGDSYCRQVHSGPYTLSTDKLKVDGREFNISHSPGHFYLEYHDYTWTFNIEIKGE